MSDSLLPRGSFTAAEAVISIAGKPVGKVSNLEINISGFKTLETVEREYIEHALSEFENNKSKTAQALGITVKTLYNKLHYYGLFEKYASGK